MTVRQLHRIMVLFDECSYLITDADNKVLCMPCTWMNVPRQLRDLEIYTALLKDSSTSNEKVMDICIQIKR